MTTMALPISQDDLSSDDAEQEARSMRGGWAGWLISVGFHLALIGVMSSIYFLVSVPEVDLPPVRIATIEPPPTPRETPKPERSLDVQVELEATSEAEIPTPISQLDLPVEVSEREEETDSPIAKGREEAVADSELGGSGAFMAVGAGGGSAGMFGARAGGGKKRAIGRFGGSKGSESAVDAALRWFKKHQSPSGAWDAEKHNQNCIEAPKCEPGKHSQFGELETNIAMTGYVVLCYLGAGYDHQTPNKYKQTVKKGIEYLLSAQKPDGSLGTINYQNAIATMALTEAFAMTGDPALKTPSQLGVNTILARQNRDLKAGVPKADAKSDPYGGFGWDYAEATSRNDSSVSGWNVMALKSAIAAQLDVGNGMAGAKRWLERTWKLRNPDWAKLDPYKGESVFPYGIMSDTDKLYGDHLACVGAVCAVFLGHHAGDVMLETLANHIMAKQTPTAYPCNTYFMYYNTLAIFQVGGERWKRWNGSVRDMLVAAQRTGDGCFDGSWDWEGTEFHGHDIGRVLSTAYCCLSLEVYYRYAQVQGAEKDHGRKH
ncbi:MAG: terpene cyclase/mutase family protein [Planctomycetes bacterium]|nr:terpene cyclase/mutase family protein [Planctomycetota bacterium]